MIEMNLENDLVKFGFVRVGAEVPTFKYRCGDGDRFRTEFFWYGDEPNLIYINRYLTRGVETISEDSVLTNHNDLHSDAKHKYLAIKDKFNFKCAFTNAVSEVLSCD